MQKSNVRRLLFPAIASSALVFGLTLLLMGTYKSELFEQVAKTRQEDLARDYTLTHKGRDTAVRVVGGAIVLSVATGIFTVEMLRKWYADREKIAQKSEAMGSSLNAQTTPPPDSPPPGITEPTLDLQINQLEWSQPLDTDPLNDPNSLSRPELSPIVELAWTEGHTDRELLPNSLQTHYVLHHQNHRYSFLRTACNRSKMLRYSTLCQTQGQEVIAKLNADGESYSLWVKEKLSSTI